MLGQNGKRCFSAALICGLAACASPQQKGETLQLDKADVTAITYPTQIRGAYVFQNGTSLKICAEPPPDVALDTLQKLAGKLDLTIHQGAKVGAEASSELNAKVVQLAGRSQLILLARELLYRACEMSINGTLNSSETVELYKEVVKLVRDLGKADLERAKAESLKHAKALKDAGEIVDKILGK